MAIHGINDVFTPTKPARIAFVERDSINDRLVNALTTPGKQLVVYGHSGTGKTTLLANKLTQLYERNITTRCMKGLKFDQLILDAFDQLGPYYKSEKNGLKKTASGIDLTASYEVLQAKISSQVTVEEGEKHVRILPPQLTPQALGRFLGAQNACWVLEDFHKIEGDEKIKLSQLMKVFMDLSDEYESLKIIALGAVDTARQVIEYDPEMRNRVAEINVTLMTEPEIMAIIAKGEAALNVEISPSIKELIGRHSNGLASVCHHLCLYMCMAAGVTKTMEGERLQLNREHFESAVKNYAEDASDSIKNAFDKALKKRRASQFDNAKLILEALCALPDVGAARADILKRIKRQHTTYPETNLKYFLAKLVSPEYGGLVRYDSNSGRYSFSEPIFRAYALTQFKSRVPSGTAAVEALTKALLRIFSEEGSHVQTVTFRSISDARSVKRSEE